MRRCIPGIIFVLAVQVPTGCSLLPKCNDPPGSLRTVQIFAEVEYTLRKRRPIRFRSDLEARHRSTYIGSGFLSDDRIVTARHVVFGPEPGSIRQLGDLKIGDGEYAIEARRVRIKVSNRGYEPVAIWASQTTDLAVIRLPNGAARRLGLMPLAAARRSPQINDQVCVWGFPGNTSAPQMTERSRDGGILRITAVYPEHLVLNGPLEHGFSGGPVLSLNGDILLGMAIRSEERQTRVLRLDFAPSKMTLVPYKDHLDIHPVQQRFTGNDA